MFTAEQARARTHEAVVGKFFDRMNLTIKILEEIEKRANNGKHYLIFNGPVSQNTFKVLESLGYKIIKNTHTQHYISW
jgi:hypothetical protein